MSSDAHTARYRRGAAASVALLILFLAASNGDRAC